MTSSEKPKCQAKIRCCLFTCLDSVNNDLSEIRLGHLGVSCGPDGPQYVQLALAVMVCASIEVGASIARRRRLRCLQCGGRP
jgi:hypothetical protein